MSWTTDITNDPSRDFALYVELMLGDTYVARLQRNADGLLELRYYGGDPVTIPVDWLFGLAKRFEEEVPAESG